MAIAHMASRCNAVAQLKPLQHRNEDRDRRDRAIGSNRAQILMLRRETSGGRLLADCLCEAHPSLAALPSPIRQRYRKGRLSRILCNKCRSQRLSGRAPVGPKDENLPAAVIRAAI